jgi:DNA-binding response OmpR family regulator
MLAGQAFLKLHEGFIMKLLWFKAFPDYKRTQTIPMRILIIEDEEKLAKSLKKSLEKESYAVDYVTDGEAGQRRIEMYHNDYDMVILDLMLPKKTGFEVCKNVRSQKINVPILILTAKYGTYDKIDALDSGADDYLVKPFALEELLARVRALMRRPSEALPTELSVGDLVMNLGTRSVTRNGKEIPLTVKEFALLEYLMRHPNQVLNRNQISDHLWGFDFDSFSNVVDVHMKNLRRKIETRNPKMLETVRGVGYRLKTA